MRLTIVYPAAGMSSRFGGIKQLVKVTDTETLIEYSLNQSLKAGFKKIIFIVGKKTEQPFKEKFGTSYKGIPVFYTLQTYDEKERDRPWGTVDALCTTIGILKEPFVFCNSDDIYGENAFKVLYSHLLNSDYEATIGYKLSESIPDNGKTNRGIIKSRKGYVEDIVETFEIEKSRLSEKNLSPDSLCSMNIFGLHPSTLAFLQERLQNFKKNHKGDRKAECLLPSELASLIKEKKIKMKIYIAKDKWMGVTNPGDEILIRKFIETNKANL